MLIKNQLNVEYIKNFRELNLTILTSIGLGLSLGIAGEITSTIIIGNYESQYIYAYLGLFIGITAAFSSPIIWFSLPRVQFRDFHFMKRKLLLKSILIAYGITFLILIFK
jgi:hypothetical protein